MSKNDTNAAAAVRAAADDPKIKTPESEMDDDDTQDDGDDENDRADAKAKDDDKRSSPEPKKRGRPRKSDAERAKPKPPSPSDGDESADDDDDEPAANLRLVEAVEKRLMVERRRISDIRDAAQRWDADAAIEKRAIDEGWDMKRFGYEAMEHAIQNQPKIDHRIYPKITGGRDARETAGEAMVNAMLNRAHGDRVPLSDHAREYRGMSILDMAKESLTDHGVRVRGMNRFEIAGEAMKKRAGSAAGMHSTSDFPGILENALNKSLRMGYQESARSFTAWARRTTVSDFRAAPRVMMSETPALLKVNEHSEFKEGAITESREFNQVHTYGRIVSITRQVLVNDDLGAFTTIPQRFGASVAALESDIVYGVLLSNPTLLTDSTALFHADHNNLDGTGAAISLTNVQTGRAAIWNQTGLSGRPINVPPKFILVPPELELLAWQLVTMVTPNQSNQVTPDYIRNMVVIVEPRLKQCANGAAGDANAWYLIADPMTVDTIEYAYLEGSEGVYTETEDGFDVDGMRVKVRHDFGAAAIDYRGMYKNVGA